jgi:drug/metabolite transporter (DMT)-like permease
MNAPQRVATLAAAQPAHPAHPSHQPESRLAFLALMGSGLVWGLVWWPLKYFAAVGLSGHAIGLSAYTLVAVVALPLILRERARWQGEYRLLLAIGLFFGCANMAFTMALTMGSVVRAMLLFYLLPAWGAIGGALFLGERLGPRRLLAVALSLAGVFVIMGGVAALRQPLSLADGMALAAGFCYTAASIANRRARAIPMTSRTLASFVGCTVVGVAALLFSTPVFPVLPAATWLLGGTLLTTYGVTHIQASRAAVLQVVELLVAVASAVWLSDEQIRLKEYVGGALIVAATMLEAGNQSKG